MCRLVSLCLSELETDKAIKALRETLQNIKRQMNKELVDQRELVTQKDKDLNQKDAMLEEKDSLLEDKRQELAAKGMGVCRQVYRRRAERTHMHTCIYIFNSIERYMCN